MSRNSFPFFFFSLQNTGSLILMITEGNPSSYFLRSHKYNSPYFRYRFHFAFNIYSETNIKRTSSKISKFFKISRKKVGFKEDGERNTTFRFSFATMKHRRTKGEENAKGETCRSRYRDLRSETVGSRRFVVYARAASCMASVSAPITMALFNPSMKQTKPVVIFIFLPR